MQLNQPTPELPVADVERAQNYYRDVLGCKIEWIYPGKEIGAVSNGDTALFFRKRTGSFEPTAHWIFAEDIDKLFDEMVPWGLRQFTIKDLDGNVFYIHHDM